ncbi:IS30 family transposase [Prevotella nigrescens]|uniref:IS30 family transposase n=1 Tax=Prevotella nigrescens TaxID=28133 RepID=UPI003C78609A
MIHADESGKLVRNCRHKMAYHRRHPKVRETKATNIKNRVSIHERPIEADGKRFGDWGMDLIVDSNSNAILTMVERSTNYLLMAKLKEGKKSMPLAKTVWRLLLPYKGRTFRTITTDNGSDFAAHEWIMDKLGVAVFFTDAYCSWQKGTVENANRLIRKYIPKKANFDESSHKRIMNIQKKLNRRPREKLNFDTPINCFFKTFH